MKNVLVGINVKVEQMRIIAAVQMRVSVSGETGHHKDEFPIEHFFAITPDGATADRLEESELREFAEMFTNAANKMAERSDATKALRG